jgi:hypothetical protein
MPWIFGESFDLYADLGNAMTGYWDGGGFGQTLQAGRFTGSQCLRTTSTNAIGTYKNSGSNDAVHHIFCAIRDNQALSGASPMEFFTLGDGSSAQCSVVFRSDGALILTSGSPTGTTLATYTGAVSAHATWFAFEIEVVINNTTGSFTVRKNGNTSNDFTLGSLNTRAGTANNYANRLTVGMQNAPGGTGWDLDDILWRSDTASVPWVGDIRCYTRMPVSDASVQFSRPAIYVQTPVAANSTTSVVAGRGQYTSFTAAVDGTVGTATVSMAAGYTGNMKCSLFASSGSAPTTVLGSANVLANPATGSNTLTFGTPITLVKGTQYWIGFDSDTGSGTWNIGAVGSGAFSTTAYASFPVASPSVTGSSFPVVCTLSIAVSSNNTLVNETLQDAVNTYVYDSTAGHADYYGIAGIGSTPVSTVAVTTRGYMQKSDIGSRTAAVQIKSGSTTVASSAVTLTTSGWLWAWRTDTTDPNTGSAWTATAVNNAQIGPTVVT